MRGENIMNRTRLTQKSWKCTISTSTHDVFFKKDWQCTVDRRTNQMTFTRKRKSTLTQRCNLMRGEVEGGIE